MDHMDKETEKYFTRHCELLDYPQYQKIFHLKIDNSKKVAQIIDLVHEIENNLNKIKEIEKDFTEIKSNNKISDCATEIVIAIKKVFKS